MPELKQLDIVELLGLIDCPQKEVAEEIQGILRDELKKVKDVWLIKGLIDYFFATNSHQMLEFIISVKGIHADNLMKYLAEGLSSHNKLPFTCLFLFFVQHQPPPIWLNKLVSSGFAIRELINVLHKENDVPVLVSGLVILVILLPMYPVDIAQFLPEILEVFKRMLSYTPQNNDACFQPYVQVAVYSLFHRLYALYPWHLLENLRLHFQGHKEKNVFFTTLRPMIERVRLHPILISETKESELNLGRWIGLESHQVAHECSKVCLDQLESTCEDPPDSWTFSIIQSDVATDPLQGPSVLGFNDSENFFWSPCLAPRPRGSISGRPGSVSQTPVYTKSVTPRKVSSSPETAIEATPETTPYATPVKCEPVPENPWFSANPSALRNITAQLEILQSQYAGSEVNCPVSPRSKGNIPFIFPEGKSQDIMATAEKSSIIQSKLQQINFERKTLVKLDLPCKDKEIISKVESDFDSAFQKLENLKTPPLDCSVKSPQRKISVFNDDGVNLSGLKMTESYNESDFGEMFSPTKLDRRISEEECISSEITNKFNSDIHNETYGLGVPSHRSMTDLFKTTKTMRLRFLSQCGPSPDISSIKISPQSFQLSNQFRPLVEPKKSNSCPDLSSSLFSSFSSVKDVSCSSFKRSPVEAESVEVATQTEENSINPYEQFMEALIPIKAKDIACCINEQEEDSPHQLLDRYLKSYNVDSKTNYMQNQNVIFCALLLLERHRRKVHAERNRRLLSRARRLYELEAQGSELKKKVVRLEEQNDAMQIELTNSKSQWLVKEDALKNRVKQLEAKLEEVMNEKLDACQKKNFCEGSLRALKEEVDCKIKEVKQLKAEHTEKDRCLDVGSKAVIENKILRKRVTALEKRVTLMGEFHQVVQRRLGELEHLERDDSIKSKELSNVNETDCVKESLIDAQSLIKVQESKIIELHEKLLEWEKKEEQWKKEKMVLSDAKSEESSLLDQRIKSLTAANITFGKQISKLHYRADALTQMIQKGRRAASFCSQNIDSMQPEGFTSDTTDTEVIVPEINLPHLGICKVIHAKDGGFMSPSMLHPKGATKNKSRNQMSDIKSEV